MTISNSSHLLSRRRALADQIGPDAALLIANPSERVRSHDTHYPYRAHSDMLYLCGFPEPHAILVLTPGHDQGDFHLFVPPRDPLREQWEGRRAGPEGAIRDFGAHQAHPLDALDKELPALLAGRAALYHALGQDDALDKRLLTTLDQLRNRRGHHPPSPTQIHDPRPLLELMRAKKDPHELSLMREAAQISSEAHQLAMRATRPGLYEYQLQALIEYHFASRGAPSPAYSTIVGSGPNANILHYVTNRDRLRDGDMVLVDAGCEYAHYAADITRTWPVNGRFSPPQLDLYQAVLSIQLRLIEACATRPTGEALTALTTRLTIEALRDLDVLRGDTDELIDQRAHKPYAPHGFGHWLGIDVHDPSPYYDARGSLPLSPGHVLTIEPGLYIPLDDELAPRALRGLGVRIEDDILITDSGVEVLTSSCPKDPAELAELVGSGASISL